MSIDEDSDDIESSRETDDDGFSLGDSVAPRTTEQAQDSLSQPRKKPKRSWNDRYLTKFPWIYYNVEKRVASCKYHQCNVYKSLK